MGCTQSKTNIIKERDTFSEHSSSASDSSNGGEEGRLGIARHNSTISSSTSSSSIQVQLEYVPPIRYLIENCAPGMQNMNTIMSVSDDSSSDESNDGAVNNSTPDESNATSSRPDTDVTFSNQSMEDNAGDEDVVDWLIESESSTNTSLSTANSITDLGNQSRHSAAAMTLTHLWANHNDDNNNGDHVVMDTTKADRRHMPLPHSRPPLVKTGDWLSNRYIVNDYIILSEIGSGAHSIVRLAKHKTSNNLFAVKIMNRKLLESKVDIQKEVAIMKKMCTHQNILRLYEVIDDCSVNKVYLVTELAERGDLLNIIKANANISPNDLKDIICQMMKGLLHIHENNCTHNDLKPSNVLLTRDNTVKISDFGISSLGRRVRINDSAGTPAYSSPEVLCGEPNDGRLADCYSLGATIFHLVCKKPPFVGVGGQKNKKLLDLYEQIKHAPLRVPSDVDSQLKTLISRLMHKDPMQRMPLVEALKHQRLES